MSWIPLVVAGGPLPYVEGQHNGWCRALAGLRVEAGTGVI